jgi:hypothetical protein
MAVTELEFPRPVADMCADLAGQGFDVLEEGRRHLLLQGPVNTEGHWLEAFVLITVERGQWSLAARFEGMTAPIPVASWQTYLDGEPDADLSAQASFVRFRLAEAARVISSTPQAERELARLSGAG